MNKDNIILIGMPGCGKSTLGVLLAKTLLKSFVDTDLVIQEQEGKELYKIIAEKGRKAFSEIENKAVAQVKCHNSIIATGGSVVFGEDAMRNLKSLGTVVYLKLPLHEIERRVRNIALRFFCVWGRCGVWIRWNCLCTGFLSQSHRRCAPCRLTSLKAWRKSEPMPAAGLSW